MSLNFALLILKTYKMNLKLRHIQKQFKCFYKLQLLCTELLISVIQLFLLCIY